MQMSRVLETAKIALHWDHILAPAHREAGKIQDDSWKGSAKKVAGLVLVAFSCALFGWEISALLFFNTGLYHLSRAYQKTFPINGTPIEEIGLSQEEIDRLNQLGIDTILKASTEGKKIGLIIGRDKNQPVPKEDGWLWVAGNIAGDPAALENRVDLQMDFSAEETIQKLEGMFDRVVVDISTLKFILGAWQKVAPLLKPLSSSELITETSTGCMGILFDIKDVQVDFPNGSISYPYSFQSKEMKENERLFQEWKDKVGETEFAKRKKDFLDNMEASERETLIGFGGEKELDLAFFYHILAEHYRNRYKANREATKVGVEHFRHDLKRLFDRVVVYDNAAPFPTRQGIGYGEKGSHFVLTGPTTRTKERRRVFEKL